MSCLESIKTPDFKALALEYPDTIGRYVKTNKTTSESYYDFGQGPEADCTLAEALAHKFFGIKLELDPSFLCPRIANRLIYVDWIRRLSRETCAGADREITVLDVGVGSSCIYPLLICAQEPRWKCIGTDISAESLALASKNLELNPILKKRIQLVNTGDKGGAFFDVGPFDVCMCNPPFYESAAAMRASSELKQQGPSESSKVFQARENELITRGGEYEFVARMVEESSRGASTWYTSMVGHKATLVRVVEELRRRGITNYAVHEIVTEASGGWRRFKYGTRRWVVGWSFGLARPSADLGESQSQSLRRLNPARTEAVFTMGPEAGGTGRVWARLDEIVRRRLDLGNTGSSWEEEAGGEAAVKDARVGCLRVTGDIWSRSYRRKHKRKQEEEDRGKRRKLDGQGSGEASRYIISASSSSSSGTSNNGSVTVRIWWAYGADCRLLESLATLVKQEMRSRG